MIAAPVVVAATVGSAISPTPTFGRWSGSHSWQGSWEKHRPSHGRPRPILFNVKNLAQSTPLPMKGYPMRLAAQMKGGFYSAPAQAIAFAATFLRPPRDQRFAILDPCAGE